MKNSKKQDRIITMTAAERKPLTKREVENLRKLAARPDSEIDLSDIPEIREIPPGAEIGKFYRPRKESVTIRLDADVLDWLKRSGEGYQTRINSYLRKIMSANG